MIKSNAEVEHLHVKRALRGITAIQVFGKPRSQLCVKGEIVYQ